MPCFANSSWPHNWPDGILSGDLALYSSPVEGQLQSPQERTEALVDSPDSSGSSANPIKMARKGEKTEVRKTRNKESAKSYREKRKAHIASLKERIQELASNVIRLQTQLNPDYVPEDPSSFLPVKVERARMKRLRSLSKLTGETKATAIREGNKASSARLRKRRSDYQVSLEKKVVELAEKVLNLRSQLP